MKVNVSHIGKTRFQIRARQHIIDSDQPVENGGDDAAMTPPEIFLASLGSCAAFYAAQFLSRRKLEDRGLEVSVEAEKLREPARLGNFVIKVQSPVSLTGDQSVAMERSVHHCLIHQTMLQPPQVALEIVETKEPAIV